MTKPRWIVSFSILLALIIGTLNYTGFCYKTFGYLRKKEKIRVAVDFLLKQREKEQHTEISQNFYRDVDSFLRRFPDCCKVSKSFATNESIILTGMAFAGYRSSQVYIEYSYTDSQDDKTKAVIGITNCGVAWDVLEKFY